MFQLCWRSDRKVLIPYGDTAWIPYVYTCIIGSIPFIVGILDMYINISRNPRTVSGRQSLVSGPAHKRKGCPTGLKRACAYLSACDCSERACSIFLRAAEADGERIKRTCVEHCAGHVLPPAEAASCWPQWDGKERCRAHKRAAQSYRDQCVEVLWSGECEDD